MPMKTAATEIYMAFYATLTSTIIVLIFGGLKFDYTLNVIILAVLGGIVGIWFQNYLFRVTGREAYIVAFLDFAIFFCAIAIPAMSFPAIFRREDRGIDIWEAQSYCP